MSLQKWLRGGLCFLPLLLLFLSPLAILAQEPAPAAPAAPAAEPPAAAPAAEPDLAAQLAELKTTNKVAMDTMWTLITAFLVFWMNAGFALVESGMCRVKNAVNILSKNFIVFALSSLAFFFLGWGVMFGDGTLFSSNHHF